MKVRAKQSPVQQPAYVMRDGRAHWPAEHGISLVHYLPPELIRAIPFDGINQSFGGQRASMVRAIPKPHITVFPLHVLRGTEDLSADFGRLSDKLRQIHLSGFLPFRISYDGVQVTRETYAGTRVQLVAESEILRDIRSRVLDCHPKKFEPRTTGTFTLVECFENVEADEREGVVSRVEGLFAETLPLVVTIDKLTLSYHKDNGHSQILAREDFCLTA
ncbi:hypothetical protein ACFL31_05115 [Candidatus Margulisiibacteriota bacterium]